MKEEWKDIPGYEGKYQVSNLGRVKNLIRNNILKPISKRNGYLSVSLVNNKKIKQFLVHRLVAITFLPNPNNYSIINHKDYDKTNNTIVNLEWCTQKHNVQHSIDHLKLTGVKQVLCLQNNKIIKQYPGVTYTISDGHIPSCVSRCCKGKIGQHHGYVWKYA